MIQELPAFPCPHCHERAFTKTALEEEPAEAGTVVLSHLYACHACGENYLATVEVAADRSRTETWEYYLDREIELMRSRRYAPVGPYNLAETGETFAIDGQAVTEASWRAALEGLRSAPSTAVPAPAPVFTEQWLGWWSATSAARHAAVRRAA